MEFPRFFITVLVVLLQILPAIAQSTETLSEDELNSLGASSPSSVTIENTTEIEGPIQLSVELPIDLRDATSASLLVQETQRIIEATQVEVPAGARPIHLIDVVEETLRQNLELRSSKLDPQIASTQIDVEKSAFDPVGFAKITVSRDHIPDTGFTSGGFSFEDQIQSIIQGLPTPTPAPIEVKRVVNTYKGFGSPSPGDEGLGVRQKFTSGLDATLQLNYNRTDTSVSFFQDFNAEYNTNISLDVVQPLLRGYGPTVNLAPVRIAYNDQKISEENLRFITNTIIANAHILYWQLVAARINLAIAQQSLALAVDLLRENLIRYKYGDLIAVEVYEAEAGVKSREQTVIQAENDLENRRDDIRELIAVDRNLPDWDLPLIPVDPPVFHPVHIDEDESWSLALEYNPEIRIARLGLENSRENLVLARDAFKPQFDLFARISEAGLGGTWGQSNRELFSGDFTSWAVGLQYSVPLKRRRERANIRAAELQKNQASLSLEDVEQRVLYDHREAIRNVENLERQVEAAQASVRAEKDRLEKSKIGHTQGVTTSHDLLEVQEAYAQAQFREITAIVNYYISLINLEKVRGTLLNSLGFEFVKMQDSE